MNTTVLSVSLATLLLAPVATMQAAEATRRTNGAETAGAQRICRYNVVWTSPSKNAAGVMPIGNGDIAAGVYVIENGNLYLLLAKNDALPTRATSTRPDACGSHSTPTPSSPENVSVRPSIYQAAQSGLQRMG